MKLEQIRRQKEIEEWSGSALEILTEQVGLSGTRIREGRLRRDLNIQSEGEDEEQSLRDNLHELACELMTVLDKYAEEDL